MVTDVRAWSPVGPLVLDLYSFFADGLVHGRLFGDGVLREADRSTGTTSFCTTGCSSLKTTSCSSSEIFAPARAHRCPCR